jgi:hypothetical protein
MPRSSESIGPARAIRGVLIRLLVTFLATGACACHQQVAAEETAKPALDLTLARSDRALFQLAELRGKPTLLFLFATYDGNSQLALTHLERLLQHEKRLAVLGIALQPNAPEFLDPYRDALSVTFPLSYDPAGVVLRGETGLGPIASVPAFVSLGARGQVLGVRYGALTEPQLRDFVAKSLDD